MRVHFQVEPVKGQAFGTIAEQLFDEAVDILGDEGRLMAERIRTKRFGRHTGPGLVVGMLKIRSGESRASMGFRLERSEGKAVLTVGAVFGSPLVQQALRTQEYGRVITPKRAQMLAFPPGDAGAPARAGSPFGGMQILTARMFLNQSRALGYAFVRWTPSAIQARRVGSRDFETIFLRRAGVVIPPRRPVYSEFPRLLQNLERRLNALTPTKPLRTWRPGR